MLVCCLLCGCQSAKGNNSTQIEGDTENYEYLSSEENISETAEVTEGVVESEETILEDSESSEMGTVVTDNYEKEEVVTDNSESKDTYIDSSEKIEDTVCSESEIESEDSAVTDQIEYPMVYSDATCSITITREWFENAWCYIAHLEFSDYSRLSTNSANGKYGKGYETTSNAANRLGAIFCVNGDYSSCDPNNSTVRGGVVERGNAVYGGGIYNANTGIFTSPKAAGVAGQPFSEVVPSKFTDYLSFWAFTVVNDGEVVERDSSRAQRTLIGTSGNPGDIYIVVSEGRYVDGESLGLTLNECGLLMKKLGCVFAIPLDGGGSSTIYFNGKVLNSARENERAVVDFVYFK